MIDHVLSFPADKGKWMEYDCHIFEIPSISIEISSILIKNLGFRSKYQVLFRIRDFETLGFSHFEFEFLSEIPSILKKVWNAVFLVDFMYVL